MQIRKKKKFKKAYKKLPKYFQKKVDEALIQFSKDKFLPSLNNHALKGKLLGLRSINATGDLRIIFEEKDNYIVVTLMLLGTHAELY